MAVGRTACRLLLDSCPSAWRFLPGWDGCHKQPLVLDLAYGSICPSHFSGGCDKMPDKSNLKEEVVVFCLTG